MNHYQPIKYRIAAIIASDILESIPRKLAQERWFALSLVYRDHAVGEYYLHSNKTKFHDNMLKSVEYSLKNHHTRYDYYMARGGNSGIFIYRNALDALAAGEYNSAWQVMELGKDYPLYPEPFNKHFWSMMWNYFFGNKKSLIEATNLAEEWFQKKMKTMTGYAIAFRAIALENDLLLNEALAKLLKDHKRLTAPQAFFGQKVDEIMCVWGLAVINLARLHGMQPRVDSPFIPNELILTEEEVVAALKNHPLPAWVNT